MPKVDLALVILCGIISLSASGGSLYFLWNSEVFWEVFGLSTLASIFSSIATAILRRHRG